MKEEGDLFRCDICSNVQQKNGPVPADRPEGGEGEEEVA